MPILAIPTESHTLFNPVKPVAELTPDFLEVSNAFWLRNPYEYGSFAHFILLRSSLIIPGRILLEDRTGSLKQKLYSHRSSFCLPKS
jgi:hypothetical protein